MSLYWFLKSQYADAFMNNGIMSFGHCSGYEDAALTIAQRDSEGTRSGKLDPKRTRIFVGPDSKNITEIPITSFSFSGELPEYYLRSLTTRRDAAMMTEFSADAVIEFLDESLLEEAVHNAAAFQLVTGRWKVRLKTVSYVSAAELLAVNDAEERIFVKDRTRYGTQAECRLALIPLHRAPRSERLLLTLSDVRGFARRVV